MHNKVTIDIVIVSFAQNEDLRKTTHNCIISLLESEDPEHVDFNIIVVESERALGNYQYPHTTTIYPDLPFGYHRYLNIGIEMTSNSYICICNNDLYFHNGWASEILKSMVYQDVVSASPYCSIHHPTMGFKKNDGLKLGYRVRYEIAGWCLFFKRAMLRKTGKLDENYIFWCADNDYANTLGILKMNHVLVTSSIVDHLESRTLKTVSKERELELTEGEVFYFEKKWRSRLNEELILLD